MTSALPPRVAAVEFVQAARAGASAEVQSQSLIRGGIDDVEAAAEMLAILADLVALAHTAGLVGISWPDFIHRANNAAVKSG